MKKTQFYNTTILLLLILVTSCSTTQQQTDSFSKEKEKIEQQQAISLHNLKLNNTDNENLLLNAKIKIDFPQLSNMVSAKIEIAKTDSILINITGPFNINVGKLFANQDRYIINSNLESITYTGKPTAENLKKIINIPLSFNDLVRFLRASLSESYDSYSFKTEVESEQLFVSLISDIGAEFLLVSKEQNTISQIQRKNENNETVMNIVYSNYSPLNDYNFPKKIVITFPMLNGKVEIEYQEVKILQKVTSPMSFDKPKSFRLFEFD
jgi:hypothetical protein